jgi:hypothetical protein
MTGHQRFFFEKKNQKIFMNKCRFVHRHCERSEAIHLSAPRLLRRLARAQTNEVFFASFFFRKKKTLPCVPHDLARRQREAASPRPSLRPHVKNLSADRCTTPTCSPRKATGRDLISNQIRVRT